MDPKSDPETIELIKSFQRNEITEHIVYDRLARRVKGKNAEILRRISQDELRHYREWRKFSGVEVKPDRLAVWTYLALERLLGLTFAIKLMERNEAKAEAAYGELAEIIPQAEEIMREEAQHEDLLIGMIDEERIAYIGSMVLGLNDALVELTGALAGLTFALQNAKLVGLAGFITGVSASLSMSASEYLSTKSEGQGRDPLKAALYTGVAYVITVFLLVAPYFLLSGYLAALSWAVLDALLVISAFTFFVSVVQEKPFKRTWAEMAFISLGVAVASFAIGLAARKVIGVEF